MAGTHVPGQRAVRGDRGAMERCRPRRRLARAPSRAAAACTPYAPAGRAAIKAQAARRCERPGRGPGAVAALLRGAGLRLSPQSLVRAPLLRAPEPSTTLRRPPSRDRAVGAVPAAESAPSAARRCPASPLPGTQGPGPRRPRPRPRSPPSGRRCVLHGASQRAGSRGIAPGPAQRCLWACWDL